MVKDGEGEYPIVLIRWNGKVYAVGGKFRIFRIEISYFIKI
jgi:hypothetical protein